MKPDGSIDKYRARFVVKGCSQIAGLNYNEIFSPVARYELVRIMLAVAITEDFEIVQFDVKTAFLHGDLDKTIYMEQPNGFEDGTDKVCLLLCTVFMV